MRTCCSWPLAPPAGGAEGRSGIAALLKIIKAAPGKAGGGKQGGKGAAQHGGDASDSDEEEEEGGGGGAKGAGARSAGRRIAGAAGGSGGRQGGPRQQLRPLMRPIICICNDLYAPALRPLRDVAKVFHFKKPQVGQGWRHGAAHACLLAPVPCATFIICA